MSGFFDGFPDSALLHPGYVLFLGRLSYPEVFVLVGRDVEDGFAVV